jgi:phosphopantothenoylcysteine decarboxylase/phosphopantothenate--cysteine ligase
MNDRMWEHPATRANLETLRRRGATIVEPGKGRLASKGEWGVGRLADPAEILAAVESTLGGSEGFAPRSLDGLRVLVTAGGTREPIDSVRYVGNRSSGRMGVALAEEAARRGAEVTLIAANVSLPRPEGVRWIDVETAAQLLNAAREEFASADVLLMAAAVADFRPREADGSKISKSGRDGLSLELEPTDDVLGELAPGRRPEQTLVGFAAEHGQGAVERARGKLQRKGLDAVVVNDISRTDIGFDVEDNEVTIITAADERRVARGPKSAVAAAVLDAVEGLRLRVVSKDHERRGV